ncbi:MAG: hypothetical protein AB1595_06090 [bacterium]
MKNLLGLLLLVILLSHCAKEKLVKESPDKTPYKTDYGFSILLYPEYKKVKENENGVLFSRDNEGEIAIIAFMEGSSQIKKYYSLSFGTSSFTLENCDSYIFTEKQKEGFREFLKTRLEIFPEKRDIQITLIAKETKKRYNKIMGILSTIKIE